MKVVVKSTNADIFVQFFVNIMKSRELLFPTSRYDLSILHRVLGDSPYLHYMEVTNERNDE